MRCQNRRRHGSMSTQFIAKPTVSIWLRTCALTNAASKKQARPATASLATNQIRLPVITPARELESLERIHTDLLDLLGEVVDDLR